MKLKLIQLRIFTGILFALPFMALLFFIEKLWFRFKELSEKIEKFIGQDSIFGANTSIFLIIIMFVIMFYIAGYLAGINTFSKFHNAIDNSVLQFIPGYLVYKNKINEKLDSKTELRKPIFIKGENEKKIGILIEELKSESVVFIPSIPDTNSGEILIIPNECIELINIEYKYFIRKLQLKGKGLLDK